MLNKFSVIKIHWKTCFHSLKHCTCKTHFCCTMLNIISVLKTYWKNGFPTVRHCTWHWTQLVYMMNMLIAEKRHWKYCFRWLFGIIFRTMFKMLSVIKIHWKACFQSVKHCTCKKNETQCITHWTQLVYMINMLIV